MQSLLVFFSGVNTMSEKTKLSRREARELAFKILFAKDFDNETPAKDFLDTYVEVSETPVNDYVIDTFTGVCETLSEIDEEIEAYSVKWKVGRMSVATRTVLRLAVYEMTKTETPAKVVINEAVEIIKAYDEETAPSFVNGILNNIAKQKGLFGEKN